MYICTVSQTAHWSLLTFLWCILWCLTSSSERANFFWQLGQRHVNGFSPENHQRGNKHSLLVRCNQINAYAINGFEKLKKKGLRTCFTCMSPSVGLKMVWARKLSLTCLTLKGFDACRSKAGDRETDSCGGLHILYTSDGFMTAGIGGWGNHF